MPAIIAGIFGDSAGATRRTHEAPTDGRLPMREDPIRDTEAPQLVYTGHCTDCQRLTNSAFSIGVAIPEKGFRLSGIEPRQLQRTADSGRISIRLVCPECGTWICGMPRGGMHRVRGGTFDDTSWLRPTRHI